MEKEIDTNKIMISLPEPAHLKKCKGRDGFFFLFLLHGEGSCGGIARRFGERRESVTRGNVGALPLAVTPPYFYCVVCEE